VDGDEILRPVAPQDDGAVKGFHPREVDGTSFVRGATLRKANFGFTGRYRVNRLVYFETTELPYDAIAREKQLKALNRAKKIAMIEKANPGWIDLAVELFGTGSSGM
jgi:hypothetical protein